MVAACWHEYSTTVLAVGMSNVVAGMSHELLGVESRHE
jgi:hypothetical protein